MQNAIDIALEVEKQLSRVFGDKLVKVMLYGSYAQASYTEDSDIDILALVSEQDDYIKKNQDQVVDIAAELSSKHDIFISIIVKDETLFYKRSEYVPFYMNTARHGIEIHG
jgi:uncharacterized protein